jgi:hypothetical protein
VEAVESEEVEAIENEEMEAIETTDLETEQRSQRRKRIHVRRD